MKAKKTSKKSSKPKGKPKGKGGALATTGNIRVEVSPVGVAHVIDGLCTLPNIRAEREKLSANLAGYAAELGGELAAAAVDVHTTIRQLGAVVTAARAIAAPAVGQA